jgi:hypothetical protein
MQLKQGIPETHTKIQGTHHGCLISLLSNALGTNADLGSQGRTKISCTGTASPTKYPMKEPFHISKVWWQDATLFCLFFIFYNIHTFIQSHSYITFIHRHSLRLLSISSSLSAQWGTPPCAAEPRIELGPALQQADALPTEPRRIIFTP